MDKTLMVKKDPYSSRPEIWGGVECTINRVNNSYRDQLQETGHYTRPQDILEFAALGISRLRYPILWEKHQPNADASIDWSWTRQQLKTIYDSGIEPIVGLLHHGSGPPSTDLCDQEFPYKLAAYAYEVAKEFPSILYYTPVNEPLTTARFSGLYGYWYPHHKNELSFVKMLINQVKGIVLSMQAIREINPFAWLVQTEDLAKTHSTPALSYQALFENKRRWLTYDLLCGRVNSQHFFWDYFIALGIPEADLWFFLENKCIPNIMGFNYYVTSERYLDENFANYPVSTHGGNGKIKYADTEAVRATEPAGVEFLLTEAWNRYQVPLAITECHLSSAPEEQLRWFKQIWDTCCGLKKNGMDLRAVTAWSLLGSYDWNSLLTACNGHYEPGVFDVHKGECCSTDLATLIFSLATTGYSDDPLLAQPGWWNIASTPGNYLIEYDDRK